VGRDVKLHAPQETDTVMEARDSICLGLLVVVLQVATAWAAEPPAAGPVAQPVAPGVWWVPGGIRPDRQPDGNSVVFEAPAGLIVVDTGRHQWHREAILALAHARQKAVVAIVNTHWHLDHVSGNRDLRAAYPGLRVYASDAIDGALGGFLARSAEESAAYLEDPRVHPLMREDIQADLLTIQQGKSLKPDVVVSAPGAVEIGGRPLQVHLVRHAVTAGDVWLYDEATRVVVLGDLVTLPAPFLDTACPDGWKTALEEVADVPFEVAIPGHGGPMSRAQFALYQRSFARFVDCANSTQPAQECATQWTDAIESLLEGAADEKPRAAGMAGYYVDLLRATSGRSKECGAPLQGRQTN
jgi:glyoxylase-like metal-dependent hydrolase (beta-lactamase superfamily II)